MTVPVIRPTRAATAEIRRLARRTPGLLRIGRACGDQSTEVCLTVVREIPRGDVLAETDVITMCVDPTIVSDRDLVLDVTRRRGFYFR